MTDSDMPVIDSKTLRQKIKENSIRLVDVRREQEYQQGHITNAINLPLAKLLADDSAEAIQKIAQDLGISDETSVVVYDDTFGALSSRVVWALQYIGHKDAKLLGNRLMESIADGTCIRYQADYMQLCEESDDKFAKSYPFDVDNVEEFALFCIESGGFEIC